MAKRTVYVTVKIEIIEPTADVITDDDVQHVIDETNYVFNDVDAFLLETEILGISDSL